jgi:hypothetical protein
MIIRTTTESLLFITQPDHARLAADAITHWRSDGFAEHPRRDVILRAAREHDNGWIEEDAATYVDQHGTPLDFVAVPAHVRQRIWPRAVERMAARDVYAGALIAQHAMAVYGASRSDEGWQQFFDDLSRRRDRLAERAGISLDTLESDYRFVNAADRISLAFCTGWDKALESYGYRMIPRNTIVEISPDPFDGRRVPLRVRARRLPARAYASSAALRAVFDAAPVEMLEGEAVGAS